MPKAGEEKWSVGSTAKEGASRTPPFYSLQLTLDWFNPNQNLLQILEWLKTIFPFLEYGKAQVFASAHGSDKCGNSAWTRGG